MKNLLQKLIRAASTAEEGELAAANVIREELAQFGIDGHIESWDSNRANLIGRVETAGERPALLFGCHLDVVGPGEASWKYPPFDGVESEGRIHGRGATDMKGGIAAAVTAIGEVVKSDVELKGDIVFFGAAGEESDSSGARIFVQEYRERLPELGGVILPEPTNFEVVTAHRGMLWTRVDTKGRAAHGSAPELGVNAISSMKLFLNELDGYEIDVEPHELLGGCSMSINTISGGEAINVVPDKCSVGIDIRTLPGQQYQRIVGDFEKIFAKLQRSNPQFEAEVSIVRYVGAMETDPGSGFVRDFCACVGVDETKAVGFTTDGPHFVSLGAPVLVFGPGNPEICHKPDEYIEIADVERAVEHYKDIILKFLS